eukprot:3910670-Pyramimonas_sp.AAC.2
MFCCGGLAAQETTRVQSFFRPYLDPKSLPQGRGKPVFDPGPSLDRSGSKNLCLGLPPHSGGPG